MNHTSVTIDKEVHERLKKFCKENDIRISHLVNEIVLRELEYLEHMDTFFLEELRNG